MQTVRGIIHDGTIHLTGSVLWPEGAEVQIQLVDPNNLEERTLDGGQQLNDPASIAQWIAAFDALPIPEMSADEEAAWQAGRAAQRELEKRTFADRIPEMGPGSE